MQRRPPITIVPLVCLLVTALSAKVNAQSDVTQPGDTLIASSSSSPGTEGVANAIDNTEAKYLNFDADIDTGGKPTGFVVTPSVGLTRVIGIAMLSANDAPDRDPRLVTLEGSNDDTITSFTNGNWEVIVTLTDIPSWPSVFPGGGNADRYQTQTFYFDNFKAYKHYRWTVVTTQGPSACCMQIAEVELLGSVLPGDVTQPGDALIASSASSPGTEGVANAIDNTEAKYLNFDADIDTGGKPTGLIVTPSIGKTLITGLTMQSANDAPDRDPQSVTLEGSNDATVTSFTNGNWEVIVALTNIPSWPSLFPGGGNADRYKTQTFLFDNFIPYKHYRWTVVTTQGPSACCMQIAEVELLGTGAPKDVTQPGDLLIASSASSPGTEGVANAIDNTEAKYLNFDADIDTGGKPTGFVVTPSIGATAVIGITMQSANDAPDRDPKTVIIEGSNDAQITAFTNGTWELIVGLTNITPWPTLFPGGGNADRYKTQEFYFPNRKSYLHYRWTVLETQGPSACCMQIAEVELLAATQSNPCGQTAFTLAPADAPALIGSPATFFAKVNGPWTVQWLRNGQSIPGANTLSYSTAPMLAAGDTNLYSLAIVGCQTSQVVRATIFTPSATKSIGISFIGGGANGAPTSMETNDIAGVQPQAFWFNATGGTGTLPDGITPFVDSDNVDTTISFDYQTSDTWGAGTGTDSPTDRMLNGLVGGNAPGEIGTFTFGNVPNGSHAILVYAVSPPLQFQVASYAITTGTPGTTNYIRVMNSDEYKPAPGFYRGTSANPNNPTVANFVRFDGIQPVGGVIALTVETLTAGFDQETGVNGLQLVLNAPNPGAPPTITADPQPTVAPTNGTAVLTVTATGGNLTYRWRKNGVSLPNGGNISGATSSTLTISSFSEDDVGIYSVAVFNPAGSIVSKNASVRISKYSITDALVGHWKLDETSGTTAANAVSGGRPGTVNGAATWGAGRIANAFSFDGTTYLFVDNFTKANKQIAVSAWVNVNAGVATDVAVIRNDEGPLDVSGGAARIVGQFELGLVVDQVDFLLKPMGAVGIGPNVARATGTAVFPTGWHHMAFTADGAQVRLYVDGQEVASADYLADINPPDVPWISIGARLVTDTNTVPATIVADPLEPNLMAGQLDDIGLWTRALTTDEVVKIFQAGQQGQTLSTVVITPPVDLQITGVSITSGTVTVSWTGGGTLYSASSLNPGTTWNSTGDTDGTYTAPVGTGNTFFRVQQ